MPESLLRWLVYMASLITLLVTAIHPSVEIRLLVTSGTLLLWVWLLAKCHTHPSQAPASSGSSNPEILHAARHAAGTRLQENVQKFFTPANTSLEQITGIIDAGTQKLQKNFADIASKSTKQQEQLNALISQLESGALENGDVSIEHFSRTIQEIHQDVSAAATAMQFEDATTQIAQFLQTHLKIIQASMEIVQQELQTDSDMLQCLQQIEQRLRSQQSMQPHQAVSAKNMQEGEIDLF